MRVVNLLFNHKKSTHDNKALGVERCFIDYAKYLIYNGAEVLSVFKSGVAYCDEIKETKSKILQLQAVNRGDIFSILHLAFALYKFKPEVALCHSGRAFSLVRAARFLVCGKFPIIAINHGINIKKFLKADYVLSVNSYFAQQFIEAGKSRDRSLSIPNMIDAPSDFIPLKKQPFHKPIRLGSLGRIAGEKNFASLLKAMVILLERGIDCEFYLGGIGSAEQDLRNLAKELNIENKFKLLGWTSDKRKFFEEIDIFVLPSQYETFGIVLLEAMLYSTPMITSNSWGPDEIIIDGINGLKVSKDDLNEMPKLLAEAIERFIKNEDEARKMAANAYKEFFEKYTAEIVAKKLYQICEKARLEFKK
jgi:glycosyltransferase involved in cell wall biosynthesis